MYTIKTKTIWNALLTYIDSSAYNFIMFHVLRWKYSFNLPISEAAYSSSVQFEENYQKTETNIT